MASKDLVGSAGNLRKWDDERPVGDTFETVECVQAKLYTIPWYALVWWRLSKRWWSPLSWVLWPVYALRELREDRDYHRMQALELTKWNLTVGAQLDALEDWFLDNHDKTKCNMWDALKEQEDEASGGDSVET